MSIHTHALLGSTEENDSLLSRILSLLRQPKNFRTALPLYRRLQFGRFLEGSFLLTSLPPDHSTTTTDGDIRASDSTIEPWLAAFVDRSCRPETEVWLFGSWETEPLTITTDGTTSPPLNPQVTSLLHSLILAIKALGLPPSIHARPSHSSPNNTNDKDAVSLSHSDHSALVLAIKALDLPPSIHTSMTRPSNDDRDAVGLSRSDYGGHISNPNIILWGAVHALTFPYLQALGVLAAGYNTTSVPNHMFIFSVRDLPESKSLPLSVRWGTLKKQHFPLVQSQTQIPRQSRTMAILPNLALFPTEGSEEQKGKPVAWAFVGLDSSLTTLHVEPEYRRQGLAKILTTKLLREDMDVFWQDGMERLAQGYVIVGNEASAGMCRALGGRADWEVYWIRVDLGQI